MLDNPRTQNTPQFSSGPEPPRQGAISRLFAMTKRLAGTGLVVGLLLIVGEKVLSPEFKPSTLIGTFGGKIETAEIAAKQPASVEIARRLAPRRRGRSLGCGVSGPKGAALVV